MALGPSKPGQAPLDPRPATPPPPLTDRQTDYNRISPLRGFPGTQHVLQEPRFRPHCARPRCRPRPPDRTRGLRCKGPTFETPLFLSPAACAHPLRAACRAGLLVRLTVRGGHGLWGCTVCLPRPCRILYIGHSLSSARPRAAALAPRKPHPIASPPVPRSRLRACLLGSGCLRWIE
jgi:hypothetical protein